MMAPHTMRATPSAIFQLSASPSMTSGQHQNDTGADQHGQIRGNAFRAELGEDGSSARCHRTDQRKDDPAHVGNRLTIPSSTFESHQHVHRIAAQRIDAR